MLSEPWMGFIGRLVAFTEQQFEAVENVVNLHEIQLRVGLGSISEISEDFTENKLSAGASGRSGVGPLCLPDPQRVPTDAFRALDGLHRTSGGVQRAASRGCGKCGNWTKFDIYAVF